MREYLLAIDPGIEGAWALFQEGRVASCDDCFRATPLDTGLYRPKGGKTRTWQERVSESLLVLEQRIRKIWQGKDLVRIAIEWPAVFGSAAANAAASDESITKLTYCVGYVGRVAAELSVPLVLVPVNEWKGQLPKRVVETRIRTILGEENCRDFHSHVWDAVGIGLHVKGISICRSFKSKARRS